MIAILAFRDQLDNSDRNGGDNNHVNVTALMQNKLQEDPEHHQYCKSIPHLITCPAKSGSELCDLRLAASATWWHDCQGALG